jgi:hypothetical protein
MREKVWDFFDGVMFPGRVPPGLQGAQRRSV